VSSLLPPPGSSKAAFRSAAPALLALLALAIFTAGASVAYTKSQNGSTPLAAAAPGQQAAVQALAQGRGGDQSVQVAGPTASQAAVPPVAPLGRVYLPDALVTLPKAASSSQLAAIRKIKGVQALVPVGAGKTTFDGRQVNALSVDPSTFRAYTPQPTAVSDGLWQAVARGDAVASYGLDKAKKLPLGQELPLGSAGKVRLGALAEFSLPDVDVVVNQGRGDAAKLSGAALLVSAPSGTQASLERDIAGVTGGTVSAKMLRPSFTVPASYDTGTGARGNAPSDLRSLYMQAATTCPGLPWGVLAGIGQVETNHGQNTAVSSAGAMGPMQFLPSTWQIYGVDGDGDGRANILDQVDAVYSAARYLCASGGGNPKTLYDSIFSYNHADWYVREVLGLAAQYR
jgi:Transglycosylase SLT domain